MPNVQPLTGGDPQRLGAYEVTGRLGEGGQGVVYLGRSETGSNVAIKLLHAQLIEDEAARARFVREVEVAERVARFCTAQVLEAGMLDTRPYIVSEYVPGPSLHQQLRTEGPRQGSALDRLAINTATALAAIHQAGVVHRDFKPGNVLMGPDGPVVIDFGIARALDASGSMTSAVSQVIGTPAFMAPEQLSDGQIGPATDMFAWAVTMAYAANGIPAFGHRSIPKVINRILNEEPDLGVLDGRLRDIVAACLAKDPARRPTARNLMDELMGQGPTSALSDQGRPGGTSPHGAAEASRDAGTARMPTASPYGPSGGPATYVPPGAEPTAFGSVGGEPTAFGSSGGEPGVYGPAGGAYGASGAHGSVGGQPGAYGSSGGEPGPYGAPEGGTMRIPSYESRPPSGPYGPASGPLPDLPPERRSRAGWIIGGIAAALVALIIGIAVASSGGSNDNQAGTVPSAEPSKKARPIRHRKAPPRTPSQQPTTAKPAVLANPHTPQGLCGPGFRVIDAHAVGGARIFLLYKTQTGSNCVVTWVPRSAGKVPMSTALAVKGGPHQAVSGSYLFNAGPVRLPAKGKCVMWGGSWRAAKWTSPTWSHCRR